MKASELLRTLDKWDKQGLWAFDLARLKMIFNEKDASLKTALMRHVKAGIITRVCRGIYVNPRGRSLPVEPLLSLVSFMRPYEFSYLSLESVLSDAGWISQIPFCYTVMTTGRSSVYNTPYGVLEFTHTTNPAKTPDVEFDSSRDIYVASAERAYQELRHVRRNLDLVEVPEEEAS